MSLIIVTDEKEKFFTTKTTWNLQSKEIKVCLKKRRVLIKGQTYGKARGP